MYTAYQFRQERAALVTWMAQDGYSHALTLNTDRELSRPRLERIFSDFCHRFDKTVLGRNLNRVAQKARLRAIAFPENLSTNAYLHACVDLGPAIAVLGSEAQTLRLAKTIWLQVTHGAGSFCLKAEPDSGWGRYITKRYDGTFFLSADFWPQ